MLQPFVRLSPSSLQRYICCDCRRAFKLAPTSLGPHSKPCPHCRNPAPWVHNRFKAPRASDVAQWEKVRLLIANGFRFYSLAANNKPIRYPATLNEAKVWVKTWAHL